MMQNRPRAGPWAWLIVDMISQDLEDPVYRLYIESPFSLYCSGDTLVRKYKWCKLNRRFSGFSIG